MHCTLFDVSSPSPSIPPPPQSDYEGQIRTLLGYIDPSTDAVVVAGGDGTLMEVRYKT